MKLDKKLEHLLGEAHIDFGEYHILEVIPVFRDRGVVLLVPRKGGEFHYFCLQDDGRHLYYGSIEKMMAVCVECDYLTQREADKLTREYYAWKNN